MSPLSILSFLNFLPFPFSRTSVVGLAIVFLFKPFLKTDFVGLIESTSLWVVIPVEVRLSTVGFPQTPRKRDPHWEFAVVVVVVLLIGSSPALDNPCQIPCPHV